MAFNFGGGSIFGQSTVAAPASGQSFGLSTGPGQQGDAIAVATYDELLPARSVWYKVDSLLRTISSSSSNRVSVLNSEIDDAFKAKQELIRLLKDLKTPNSLAQRLLLRNRTNSILEKVSPDNSLRQRLQQHPVVSLSIEQPDGTVTQQEATITPSMLNDICMIADDLMVPEIVAISLYQQAVSSKVPFHSKFVQRLQNNSNVTHDANSVPWMAREIYYSQSSLLLHSCLSLLQNRLRESNLESSLNPITEATDYLLQAGLITNLIELVREYTQRIDALLAESNEGRAIPGNFALPSPPTAHQTSAHFWRNEVALQACYGERQLAVECLYFIAYNTQMQGDEVVSLMELLRHITNNCIIFDPYTDVPDPMESIPFGTTATTSSIYNFNSAAPWLAQQPQREKDALAWERELVSTAMQTGQPQLLRCGCTILVALFSALGDKAILMDRMRHVPNAIGIGNALFPPGSTSMVGLSIIQKYLQVNRDSNAPWKRPDVLGLVLASYSLLLQSSIGSPVDTTNDIVKSFRECVAVSLEMKSFSFARLSLIPALRLHETITNDYAFETVDSYCNVTEFFLASIADFSAHYMNVFSTLDQPLMSRAKWEEHAEADLKARREQQEREQNLGGNFPKWSDPATLGSSENTIPNQVDCLARPDCIDDVVAFSTEIGVVGPEYALQFWSQESIKSDSDEAIVSIKLVPSQAVTWLEQQQRNDDSLRPVYLSLLAALALAKNPSSGFSGSGADEVYRLISAEGDDGSGWSILVETFRWYIRQLSPDVLTTRAPSASVSSSTGSTAYYYSDQEVNNATNTMFGTAERSKSGEAVSQSRPRELGETNEYILHSSLAILTNVALYSASARSTIINIHLPIVESDGETVGQESVLAILFSLAVMPLSPDIRGAVFLAISKLLSVEDLTEEERDNFRLTAIKGWEMLEQHQILPINLLQQYPSMHDPSYHGTPNMSFPPSSSALAIGTSKSVELWIPPDPRYAIIYEMEFVESQLGYYPSTMGFLELLSSLFSVGGFPADLGQNWRSRTGCTPYIEYVIDYVLPRVTGRFERFPPIQFRSTQEKSRLTAIALEVVATVLSRYHISKATPTLELSVDKLIDDLFATSEVSATRELFLKELVLEVTIRPHPEDFPLLIDDYSNSTQTPVLQENPATTRQSTLLTSPAPRPKTPGYSILAGMLSSKRHTLFRSVISPLIYCHRVQSRQHDADVRSLVNALYVSTPPTLTSAKDGARRLWPVNARQLLLTSLRPSSYMNDQSDFMEREIVSVLRVLCGTLAREESFRYHVSLTKQAIHVPVLRFSKTSSLPTTLELQPSKLSSLLISSEMETGVVSSIVELIGNFSKTAQATTLISAMATAITFYVERAASPKQALELFSCRNRRQTNGGLALAITTRFTLASSTPLLEFDARLLVFIFDQLLMYFRTNTNYGTLAKVMFGEKSAYDSATTVFGCVDAMLALIDNVDFVFGEFSAEVATLCFETFYRLIAIGNGSHDVETALIIAEHLRSRDFWTLGILKLCSTLSSLPVASDNENINRHNVVHSVAWLLKGVACELRILSGISKDYTISPGLERLVASHPNLFKQLVGVVFSDQGLVDYALCVLPIERPIFFANADAPSDEKCVIEAKHSIRGAPEVVCGYDVLNFETLCNLLKARKHPVNENGLRLWIEQWNHSVHVDCSSAHLSDAIRRVIETSQACCYTHGFDFTSSTMMGKRTIYQLISIMTPVEDDLHNIESIDATYFTTACRNIASAACILSSAIGDEWCNDKDELEFLALPNLIMLSIACSVADNRSHAEFTRVRERIVALAGVLLPMLPACPRQSMQNDTGRFWFQGAVVLAHLCTNGNTYSQKKIRIAPSHDDFVIQTCLCELLQNLCSESGSNSFSSCRAILTHTNSKEQTPPIRGMLNSIKCFDESVALLVQRLVSISPEISELFLLSGILEALQQAADIYCLEEKRFLELLARNVNYNAAQIKIPTYLIGHFEILSALLASEVPPMLLKDSIPKIVEFLGTYINLFERLVNCFPVGGDTLYALLRCIAQTHVLQIEKCQRKTAVGETLSLMSNHDSDGFMSFLGPVTKLITHVAEYPLPSHMLDPVPSCLKNPRLASALVTVIDSNLPSWWDVQDDRSADIDDICRIATLGMELVQFGVLFIRHIASWSKLDEFSLSRCICRCSNAASKIESALQSSREGLEVKTHQPVALAELSTLRSKIMDSLESILILTVSFVQNQAAINDISRVESCRRTITFALDYLNVRPSTLNGDDENYACIISDLSCELRRMLNPGNSL